MEAGPPGRGVHVGDSPQLSEHLRTSQNICRMLQERRQILPIVVQNLLGASPCHGSGGYETDGGWARAS